MAAGFWGEKPGIFQGEIFPTNPPTPETELFTKNPPPKKGKTDRTLKNRQSRRDSLTKKFLDKNGQHFPLERDKKTDTTRGWGRVGSRSSSQRVSEHSRSSSRNSLFHPHLREARSISAINSGKPFRRSTWNENKAER